VPEDALADVAAPGRDLAQLVDELEQAQIDRAELARDSESAAAPAHRDSEQTPNEIVGCLLQRVPVAMRKGAEPEPARAAGLDDMELGCPSTGHRVSVLQVGREGAGGRGPRRAAESAAVGPTKFDEARDATRRTRLANERTYLAWWRTGLTTFAVSVAAGRLVPELSSGAAWPFEVIGVAFAVAGLLFIAYAYVRQKRVEEALARGEYAPFETRAALVFAALGVILGIGTITVILAQPA
jgi:putative membrane protein